MACRERDSWHRNPGNQSVYLKKGLNIRVWKCVSWKIFYFNTQNNYFVFPLLVQGSTDDSSPMFRHNSQWSHSSWPETITIITPSDLNILLNDFATDALLVISFIQLDHTSELLLAFASLLQTYCLVTLACHVDSVFIMWGRSECTRRCCCSAKLITTTCTNNRGNNQE